MNKEEFKQQIIATTSPLPGSIPYDISRKFSVKGNYDQAKLIDFLNGFLGHLTDGYWRQAIAEKRLLLEDKPTTPDQVVRAGMRLNHIVRDFTEPEVSNQITLIYDDDDLIAINKPAPLPMHACGRFNKNSLLNFLNSSFPKIPFKIIHRLDADTTGLVLFAKNKQSAQNLAQQFKDRTLTKTYLAEVEGIVAEDKFTSYETIGKETIASGAREVVTTGLECETICQVITRCHKTNRTVLSVEPKSGRTNQIRIHLASIGHPIIGDLCYGEDKGKVKPLTLETNTLCLHAWQLAFSHPVTQEKIVLSATPPSNKFTLFDK